MAGGLVNIVSYGTQDIYLTGTPQISFFKIVYRRHTNFSVESIELPFDDETGFDIESRITFLPIADLIHKIYIKVDLPQINFPRTISLEDKKVANEKYNIAKNDYKRFVTFMSVNSNAYRAAVDVYNAANIVYSTEMVNNIIAVFDSYSTDAYVQSCISYFESNTPIWYIQPEQFHLLLIANSITDPSTYSKQDLKKRLDDAMDYCRRIQGYYEDSLRSAYQNQLDVVNPNFKFAWVDRLGHAIIDYVQLSIGGEKIDRQYGDWLNIWYELAGNKHLDETYQKLIGNVPELTNFDRTPKPSYSLYIPLQFWFNRFNGLAIPLISLQYHEVTLTIKLKKFSQCSYIEDMRNYTGVNFAESADLDDMFVDGNFAMNMTLYVDYVYLDRQERKRFAQSSHEYLITQLQVMEINDISQPNIQVRPDFVNPSNELIWVLQKDAYVQNTNGFIKCRWNNYSTTKLNKGMSLDFAALDFNGYSRIDKFGGAFFNYLQPYYHHSNTPSDGINVYSFCLRPEEQQPTGSCNFTRITKMLFQLWIKPDMFIYYPSDATDEVASSISVQNDITPQVTAVTIRIYTMNYNVLRILSGIGGLAYQ